MTIREHLEVIEDGLKAWAKTVGAQVKISPDEVTALDLLRSKPGSCMVAIVFTTEEPRDPERSELGHVDRLYKIIISRGRGFRVDSGESLTEGTGGGKPMFELLEECREVLRGIEFTAEGADSEDVVPQYAGIGPFTVQGFVLDAYEIRIKAGTLLPGHGGAKES